MQHIQKMHVENMLTRICQPCITMGVFGFATVVIVMRRYITEASEAMDMALCRRTGCYSNLNLSIVI